MPLGSEGGTLAILYTQQHLCRAIENILPLHSKIKGTSLVVILEMRLSSMTYKSLIS